MEDTSTSQETNTPAVKEKRWNLRERPTPVQRLDSSADASQELEMVAGSSRKRKAAESRPPVAKRKAHKSPPLQRRTTVSEQEEEDGMFSAVLAGKSSLQSVASEWTDRYQAASEDAMVELVQYFVLCCGCRATITMEMFQNEDTTSVIRSLTENFDEDSGDYPLIAAGATYKKFKSSFAEFLEHIVEQCRHSILFDEYMLDTLIIWLVGFTDSQVRAFRHTCTLACVKLVTALVHVANSVSTELDNTQRQIDAEKKRQQAKKGAAGKLEKLLTKRAELQRCSTELGDTMKGVFSSVFVHRYRDVRPEIRALCLAELGVWMMEYRAQFLADSYLKYVGWCLYDKVGEVRLASMSVLELLYSSEETAPHLELFTQRFKDRLLSMRLDREDVVCVKAIQLASHLLPLDLLEPEDCVEVCELMFVESRTVSHTAGDFATHYLFSDDFMTRAKQAKVPKGEYEAVI
jgi:cohesin complex subunit SA-1/2